MLSIFVHVGGGHVCAHTHTSGGPRLMSGIFCDGFCTLFFEGGALKPRALRITGRRLGPPSIYMGIWESEL